MHASGRLALLLLLTAACFRDTPPPDLAATSSSGAASSSTGSSGDASSSSSSSEPETGTSTSSTGEGATTCAATVWYLDADKDGHGDPDSMELACSQPTGHVEVGDDCDDDNAARAPGLPELCDDQDNDCDLLIDEYSALNTSCKDCVLTAMGTSSYAFCQFDRTFADARIACQERGGDLVVIEDQAENTMLAQKGLALQGMASQWYIGVNDIAVEGSFVWLDGDPVMVSFWGDGEPSDTNDEDCGVLLAGSSTWNDGQCGLGVFFICEIAG